MNTSQPESDRTVLITGGAGYVGAVLSPRLLELGYTVKVLDLYLFGDDVLGELDGHPQLVQIRGDIRDAGLLREVMRGVDTVIHLACISNDPSFELDPELGKSINFDAFQPLVDIAKDAGVRRFVYASSSSVYGISDQPHVTEDHELKPLTDYSKFKALCEPILLERQSSDFSTIIVRPATVCGYSPRQRLDLIVNILTNHAVNNRKITVFGGSQLRPNIHIADMIRVYEMMLDMPDERVGGKVFNAGYQNHSVEDIALTVKSVVEAEMPELAPIEITTQPTDDLRSYHIASDKIRDELGFEPKHTIEDAVRDLVRALRSGRVPNPMDDSRYYNVRVMKTAGAV